MIKNQTSIIVMLLSIVDLKNMYLQDTLLHNEKIILQDNLWQLVDTEKLQFQKIATQKLLAAAKSGDLKMFQEAFQAGADINAKDAQGMTVLLLTIKPMMHSPFSTKSKIINKIEIEQRIAIVQQLLVMGVDVNVKGHDGLTALMAAVGSDTIVLVKELLDVGADVNVKGPMGTILMFAVMIGNVAIVQALLQAGAQVNAQGSMGTALMFAAAANNLAMTKELLQAGADVHIKNDQGKTALMLAKKNNASADVIEALEQAGAKQ